MYEHRRRSTCRGRRRFRNCECKTCIPALGPVLGAKLKIRLHAKEALLSSHRENVSQLGTSREHPRLKRTDSVAGPAISGELLVGIPDEADKELLGQKLRRTPVQVEINTALILSGRIHEIIGNPRN